MFLRTRRRQRSRESYPIPNFTLLLVNGQKNFQLIFVGFNFEPGLLNSRQLGLLLVLTFQLALTFLCVALLPPLGSFHRSNCCFVAHENANEIMRSVVLRQAREFFDFFLPTPFWVNGVLYGVCSVRLSGAGFRCLAR